MPRCQSVAAKCPVAGLPTAPLHVLALPGLNPDIYTPFYFDVLGTAHFYVVSPEAVVKLTIPHGRRPPTCQDYIRYSSGDRCNYALSLHRAYFQSHSARRVFSFSRDYDEQCSKAWELSEKDDDGGCLLLDDLSGRIVERTDDKYVFVYDHN